MSDYQSVNEGTSNKGKLQEIALQCIAKYPSNQSLRTYAELLCWDMKVSFRTALDSYVLPMMRKGYFIHVRGDIYTQAQASIAKTDSTSKQCKNCHRPIPDNVTFCSKTCAEQYKQETEKQ